MLEGGFAGWAQSKLPLVPVNKLPPRNRQGRTVWVTRARPKIDRIACPWLIRRFVDPAAVFLFVAPAGSRSGRRALRRPRRSTSKGVFWSHRGELCTFDVMIEEFGLAIAAAAAARDDRARRRYRRASISRPKRRACSPRRSACRACMPTISNSSKPGMPLYDAFYRWCRDATDETHNWPTNKKGA